LDLKAKLKGMKWEIRMEMTVGVLSECGCGLLKLEKYEIERHALQNPRTFPTVGNRHGAEEEKERNERWK